MIAEEACELRQIIRSPHYLKLMGDMYFGLRIIVPINVVIVPIAFFAGGDWSLVATAVAVLCVPMAAIYYQSMSWYLLQKKPENIFYVLELNEKSKATVTSLAWGMLKTYSVGAQAISIVMSTDKAKRVSIVVDGKVKVRLPAKYLASTNGRLLDGSSWPGADFEGDLKRRSWTALYSSTKPTGG